MEKPTYNLKSSPDGLYHVFESTNGVKSVQKAIAFLPFEESANLFQLIFGDLKSDGEIDTFAVSNNKDTTVILTTVVGTLFYFFEQNPDKSVAFTGSTAARTRLYRAVISKFVNESEPFYQILGITEEGSFEIFNKNKNYTGYLISLKNEN